MSVLVHIGYFKTASTWLQRHVFGRRDRGFFPLAPERVADPERACKYLAKPLIRDRKGYLLTPFQEGQRRVQKLMGRIDLAQPGQPVISNERLSGYPMAGGHDALTVLGRIRHVFPTAKILIVIRNQHEMIRSCYVQYLRRGGMQSLEQILQPFKEDRLPRFTPRFFMYHQLIEAYQESFGRESVLVLPYEMFTSDPMKFVTSIYQFCGMTPAYEFAFHEVENRSSSSYVEYRTRYLNMFTMQTSLNGFSSHYTEQRRDRVLKLRGMLERWASEEKRAAHEQYMRETIHGFIPERFYASSNARTSSLIGIDLKAFGYATRGRRSGQPKVVPAASGVTAS